MPGARVSVKYATPAASTAAAADLPSGVTTARPCEAPESGAAIAIVSPGAICVAVSPSAWNQRRVFHNRSGSSLRSTMSDSRGLNPATTKRCGRERPFVPGIWRSHARTRGDATSSATRSTGGPPFAARGDAGSSAPATARRRALLMNTFRRFRYDISGWPCSHFRISGLSSASPAVTGWPGGTQSIASRCAGGSSSAFSGAQRG